LAKDVLASQSRALCHKKSVPPTKKIFFEYNLLDWQIHFRPWTAL